MTDIYQQQQFEQLDTNVRMLPTEQQQESDIQNKSPNKQNIKFIRQQGDNNENIQFDIVKENVDIHNSNNDNEGSLNNYQRFKHSFKKSIQQSIRQGRGNLQSIVSQRKMERFEEEYKQKQKDEKLITMEDVVKVTDKLGGFEDGRDTNAYFSDYILIEVACSCLGLLGVMLAVIEFDLEFEERNKEVAQTLCWVISITSLVLIGLTILRFSALLDWEKARNSIGKKETLVSTGIIWNAVGEMTLNLVGPLPFFVHKRVYFDCEPAGLKDLYYHVNEILSLILMLRVMLIVRTALMLSDWYSNRSQRVCRLYACKSDYLFVLKCIMLKQPYMFVSFSFLSSIFFFGFMIRVCESPLSRSLADSSQNYYSYFNSLWNIIITMTTVGYGDYYPQTHLGRFIIFVVSIWGVFIVSIMVVTMINTLNITPLENKAISVLDRLFLKDEMKATGGKVINTVGKIYLQNRKIKKGEISQEKGEKRMNELNVQLKKYMNNYRVFNRQYKSITDDNVSEEMQRQFTLIREDFKQLSYKQQVILQANADIMEHLQVEPHKAEAYKQMLLKDNAYQKFLEELLAKQEQKNKEAQDNKGKDESDFTKHFSSSGDNSGSALNKRNIDTPQHDLQQQQFNIQTQEPIRQQQDENKLKND